jgi:hypothetical protein|tara:strand:+ start:370 stop:693 length:324 start_codon:yes stop_codon:yes gene_type:complete
MAESLMKKKRNPYQKHMGLSWMRRALNPDTPITQGNKTIFTESNEFQGKEILYPTVRMINGKLTELSSKQAFDMAIKKKDFIVFQDGPSANKFAKGLTDYISTLRSR